MRRKKELLLSLVLFITLIILVYSVGYFASYLKYEDKIILETDVLSIENKKLRLELDKIDNVDITYDDYVIGKVLYRDIYSFYDEIVINLGKDSVSIGDAVVNNEGLVGIIYKVKDDISYVKLLSTDYNISVKINDTYGNLNNGIISMIDKYSNITEGDLVYTSGFSDVAEGIYVGKVESVSLDKDNLGKRIEIKLVDNKYLNYVGVIKKIK